MTMMDNAGYLYVMGGNEGNNTDPTIRIQRNDVWRSTWSLNDANSVSRLCGIPVPACGVGLTCLPSDTNSKYVNNQVTCPAIEACRSDRLSFSVQTSAAEFPARHSAGFERWTGKDMRINNVVYKKGSFVLWSGTGPENSYLDDTWVSTDAVTWAQVQTSSSANFEPAGWSGHIIDNAGRLFKIGGQRGDVRTGDVWMSTDMGQRWTKQVSSGGRGRVPLPPREFPDVFVNSQDHIFVVGGLNGDGLDDVWRSTNQGKDWNRQGIIPFANPGGRSSAALLIHKNALLNQEMFWYIGGMSRADGRVRYYNDIWVSSNQGQRWMRLTERAPFQPRDNFNAEVTDDGIIVVSAGYNNIATYNDLWMSADGGYTWAACLEEAQFSDRRWQFNAVGLDGKLLIVGGQEIERGRQTEVNDVWKSSVSFHKPRQALAQACPALKFPTCALGLVCWPGKNDVKIPDDQAATCPTLQRCKWPDDDSSTGAVDPVEPCDPEWDDDCPSSSTGGNGAASSGGLSTGALILIAILVIVGVIAIAGYFYYKRKAQNDAKFGQEGLLDGQSNISFADLSTSSHTPAPQTQAQV